MTDLRQAAQRLIDAIGREGASPLDWPEYDALCTALEQQAEPTCPDCKAAVLYECVACSSNNYPPQQQAEPVAWDKPSASFNAWWDSYRHDPANPFAEGSAAYWAWAGWMAAQRQWVGLTKVQQDDFADAYGSYEAVCAIEQALKERNT